MNGNTTLTIPTAQFNDILHCITVLNGIVNEVELNESQQTRHKFVLKVLQDNNAIIKKFLNDKQ